MHGNLYIVSAPSGSGKTTLLQSLLKSFKDLKFSTSYTTRQPRGSEKHGVDYFFVDRPAFEKMVEHGEFLEWAEYYGQLYGTSRSFVDEHLQNGDVILDIDVHGARQVKERFSSATAIFILPPSFEELERRLRARRQESDEAIRRRLEIAKGEIVFYSAYDYIIINDILENSIVLLESIVRAGTILPNRQQHRIEEIIASFGGTA
jgi:guanylate kinase